MYFINKSDIENYRNAIAKVLFLNLYPDYSFEKDFEKSNSMRCLYGKQRKPCIVSLFKMPTVVIPSNTEVFSFYQPGKSKKAKEKNNNSNIHIMELSKEFNTGYNSAFELAISDPKQYMESIADGYQMFFDNIVLKHEDIENFNRSWFKYYSKEKVQNNKHNVVDGNISFADPKTFNDPFDVNCYFANSNDMSGLFRIFCVTPKPNDILMWSYYGSDHKGYCFEYSEKDILQQILNNMQDGLCIIGDVDYKTKRPEQKSRLNSISFTEVKFYISAAFTKYEEWKHEKEYRFVLLSPSFAMTNEQYENYSVPVKNIFNGLNGDGLPIVNGSGAIITPLPINKDNSDYQLLL